MKILKKEESREQCTEAGWYAYDYELEQAVGSDDIQKLRELSNHLIYLGRLKRPFYKLEDRYLMIKGVEGSKTLRLAVYKEFEEESCRRAEEVFAKMVGKT